MLKTFRLCVPPSSVSAQQHFLRWVISVHLQRFLPRRPARSLSEEEEDGRQAPKFPVTRPSRSADKLPLYQIKRMSSYAYLYWLPRTHTHHGARFLLTVDVREGSLLEPVWWVMLQFWLIRTHEVMLLPEGEPGLIQILEQTLAVIFSFIHLLDIFFFKLVSLVDIFFKVKHLLASCLIFKILAIQTGWRQLLRALNSAILREWMSLGCNAHVI